MTDVQYGDNFLSTVEIEKIWTELNFITPALTLPKNCGAEE